MEHSGINDCQQAKVSISKDPKLGLIYLDTKQVAEILGVDQRTVEGWRTTGHGPAYCRIGGRLVRYRPSDIDAWVLKKRVLSTAQEQAPAA